MKFKNLIFSDRPFGQIVTGAIAGLCIAGLCMVVIGVAQRRYADYLKATSPPLPVLLTVKEKILNEEWKGHIDLDTGEIYMEISRKL